MTAKLVPIELNQKLILSNLMQLYLLDMSEFIGNDIGPEGLYELGPYFDLYWVESERHPFFIQNDEALAGFALAIECDHSCYSVAEFFILRNHRRAGVGTSAARALFQRFKGSWRIAQNERNTKAQAFWRKVVDQFSGGDFREGWSDQKPRGPLLTFCSSID